MRLLGELDPFGPDLGGHRIHRLGVEVGDDDEAGAGVAHEAMKAHGAGGVTLCGKNHYGSHSRRGAEVAAILYTLFESAKLTGVDPHRYVLEPTRRAIASPGTATLPGDLA